MRRIQRRHEKLLASLKGKQKIKVLFLVKVASVWKVDEVFKKMLDDDYFDPFICIVPYTAYGERRLWEEQEACKSYFEKKGYPIISLYNKVDNEWLPLSKFKPDLIFFTNEHKTTIDKYHEDAYRNFLSIYVPYYFMATNHVGNPRFLHQRELISNLWKYYLPHQPAQDEYKRFSFTHNSLVTGYPSSEPLSEGDCTKGGGVIWAPHHTIDESQTDSLSTFLTYFEFMQQMAVKYNKVKWTFKPHPSLKNKIDKLWGRAKADEYWRWWASQENTVFNNGEYIELFKNSDAIIHDCSSFIVEYAFTGKPALYLLNKNRLDGLLNIFGKAVLETYNLAESKAQIEKFVFQVVSGTIKPKTSRVFDMYFNEFYTEKKPSDLIVKDIKTCIRSV